MLSGLSWNRMALCKKTGIAVFRFTNVAHCELPPLRGSAICNTAFICKKSAAANHQTRFRITVDPAGLILVYVKAMCEVCI